MDDVFWFYFVIVLLPPCLELWSSSFLISKLIIFCELTVVDIGHRRWDAGDIVSIFRNNDVVGMTTTPDDEAVQVDYQAERNLILQR